MGLYIPYEYKLTFDFMKIVGGPEKGRLLMSWFEAISSPSNHPITREPEIIQEIPIGLGIIRNLVKVWQVRHGFGITPPGGLQNGYGSAVTGSLFQLVESSPQAEDSNLKIHDDGQAIDAGGVHIQSGQVTEFEFRPAQWLHKNPLHLAQGNFGGKPIAGLLAAEKGISVGFPWCERVLLQLVLRVVPSHRDENRLDQM